MWCIFGSMTRCLSSLGKLVLVRQPPTSTKWFNCLSGLLLWQLNHVSNWNWNCHSPNSISVWDFVDVGANLLLSGSLLNVLQGPWGQILSWLCFYWKQFCEALSWMLLTLLKSSLVADQWLLYLSEPTSIYRPRSSSQWRTPDCLYRFHFDVREQLILIIYANWWWGAAAKYVHFHSVFCNVVVEVIFYQGKHR